MKTWVRRIGLGDDGFRVLRLCDEAGRGITISELSGDEFLLEVSGEFSVGEWNLSRRDIEHLLRLNEDRG